MGGPKEGLDCLSLLQTNERILDFLWFNIPLARMGLLQPPSTTCTWFSNLFLMSLMTTQLLVKGLDGTHLSAFPCNPKGRSDGWRSPGVCCAKSYVSNVRMFTNRKRGYVSKRNRKRGYVSKRNFLHNRPRVVNGIVTLIGLTLSFLSLRLVEFLIAALAQRGKDFRRRQRQHRDDFPMQEY